MKYAKIIWPMSNNTKKLKDKARIFIVERDESMLTAKAIIKVLKKQTKPPAAINNLFSALKIEYRP